MFTEADIDRIGRSVEARTLPKCEWTHSAHFAAAMWILTHANLVAERDMPAVIRGYNEATGTRNTDTTGYHETITLASIRVARAFLTDRSHAGRAEALRELLASPLVVRTGCSLTIAVTSVLCGGAAQMGRAGSLAPPILKNVIARNELGARELQSIHVLLRSSHPNGPQVEPSARNPSRL